MCHHTVFVSSHWKSEHYPQQQLYSLIDRSSMKNTMLSLVGLKPVSLL